MTRVRGEWISCASTQEVLAMLEGGGHLAYVVGGCVRNALMGMPVGDIDMERVFRPGDLFKADQVKSETAISSSV